MREPHGGGVKKIKEQFAQLCCETLPPLSSSKLPGKFNTGNAECLCLWLMEYGTSGRMATPLIRFCHGRLGSANQRETVILLALKVETVG